MRSRRISVIALGLGLACTAAAHVAARRIIDVEDQRLLDLRAFETATVFQSFGAQLNATLVAAGALASAVDGDPAAFERLMTRESASRGLYASVALVRLDGAQPTVASSVGVPARLPSIGAPAVGRQLVAAGGAGGAPVVIGPVVQGSKRLLGVAVGAPVAPPGHLVYGEIPLPSEPVQVPGNNPFLSTIDFAIYADEGEDPHRVVFTNTDRLPLEGRRAVQGMRLGAATLPVVVAEREPLVGPMVDRLPLIILVAGLLGSVAIGGLVEHARRRREHEVRLVAALAASEQRFRTVVANSPDVIVEVDVATRTPTILNRDEVLGYDTGDVCPHALGHVVHPDDEPAMVSHWKAVLASAPGTVLDREYRVRRADGEWEWLRSRETVLERDADGLPSTVLATVTHVTEEKLAEARRVELEARLRQAQRLEAVGQLAGGVAHDFNNLLAAILSYAELVIDALDEGPVRDDVEEIKGAAERAAALTRQLLTFSRRDVVSPEVLDVNEVVRDLERLLRRTLGEHVDLRTRLHPSAPGVWLDRGELEQVVMNLAVNARDALGSGGTIVITTAPLSVDDEFAAAHPGLAPGAHLELAISDTGCGMTRDVARRAFEPFFTTKGPGRGTGMGLATVYGVATRAGGSVTIYSEPGHGTTVRVYLPATTSLPVCPSAREAVAPERGAGETVLLVEDEPGVRIAARRLLERRGFRVLEAADGHEAVRLTVQGGVDLLLTDVVMPGGLTGPEVAAHARAAEPALPVVYMSGYSSDLVTRRGVLADGVLLVEKPFTEEALIAKVHEALAGRDRLEVAR